MGLSHASILRADPRVEIVGICDSSTFVLDVLHKYTGMRTFNDATEMLSGGKPEAVIVATPTASHYGLVKDSLRYGASVFCEKPLTLRPDQSTSLGNVANQYGLHAQVGYHNRFVASFQEVKKLLEQGAIGRVTHARAEAHGPVVLKPAGNTWRSRRDHGGGCLYDYAAHPIDLAIWYLGRPESVAGTIMQRTFSEQTDDAVYSTVRFPQDVSMQLSVNWSDDSQRKMRTAVTVWGTQGTIYADRQECRAYLRGSNAPSGYQPGWNVRYTTDLTPPVAFYVRGEEYSAQLEHFVAAALSARDQSPPPHGPASTFNTAAYADELIDMLLRDHDSGQATGRDPGTLPAHFQPTYKSRRGSVVNNVRRALRR